jgi:autotransporter-associated beta strand protein
LAAPYTFDASQGTATLQDGSGTWDTVTPTWWNGTNGTADVAWVNGGDAVFGGGSSGTAGAVAISGTISANSVTFNTPFAGNYTLNGNAGPLLAINSFMADNSATTTTINVGEIQFATGASLSGSGTGLVTVNSYLQQNSAPINLSITGGYWSLTSQGNLGTVTATTGGTVGYETSLPGNYSTINLAGGTLLFIPNGANLFQSSSCTVGIVGGTHSYYNLAGIGGTSTSNFVGNAGTLRRLTYSGSGLATITLQNGSFGYSGGGTSISPMNSSGANPTVVDIASNAAWAENGSFTDYVAGITGSGYIGCSNGTSIRTIYLMPGAGAVYNFSGTTFNGTAGAAQRTPITMNATDPSGTQILSGKWALSTGNVAVNNGNLVLASPVGNVLNGAVSVEGGNLYVSNTSNYSVDQAVNVGFGGLSDDTTAFNSYLGGAPVGASINGLVTIFPGATLTAVNGATLRLAGGLSLYSGALTQFDLPSSSGTVSTLPLINITGATFTPSATITLTPYSLDSVNHTFAAGTYDLIQFGGGLTAAQSSAFALGATPPSGYSFTLSAGTDGNSLDLIVVAPVTWTGTASTAWETGGNWKPSGVPVSGSGLVFGSSGANGTVTMASPHTAGQLIFESNVSTTISTSNGSALTLDTGASTDFITSSGTQAINVPLVLNSDLALSVLSGTLSIGGNISNPTASHSLTLDGPGTLVLGGTNTYSGGTTVSGGTLVVTTPGALYTGTSLTIGASASSIFNGTVVSAGVASPVPEPGTLVLLAAGGVLAALTAWRRRN